MAFVHRLNHLRLKLFSHQFRRCYVQSPCTSMLNYTTKTSKLCTLESPIWDGFERTTSKRPIDFSNNVRFFATSFQAKTKKEGMDGSGPRLNDQIRAQYIRLVTDEGHGIVPLREALQQASKLKLDLVEECSFRDLYERAVASVAYRVVNRNVDPPVCKIMDFHKEKYKRQLKEKDRAKTKSEVALRKGDCKEIRFFAKTEQKDLKMKADTVIRLIQRGYRVKCMALGSPKKGGRALLRKGYGDENLTEEEIAERIKQEEEEEKEELGTLLSRLTALIEDEYVVESGPRVEKKQAYVIVRHAKFGSSKKGGAKRSKDVKEMTTKLPTDSLPSSIENSLMSETDLAESCMETEDESLSNEDDIPNEKGDNDKATWSVNSTDGFGRVSTLTNDDKDPSINRREDLNGLAKADSSQMSFSIPNLFQPKPVQDSKQADRLPSPPQPSLGTENRYKRSEQRQQFPPSTSRDGRGPDSFRFEQQFSPRNGHPQLEINATPSRGERKQVQTDSSTLRNVRLPSDMAKQPNAPSRTNSEASSYGIFSSLKASSPGKQVITAEINNKTEENRYSSGRDSNKREERANPKFSNSKVDGDQRQGDGGGQARWGIFSRDGPSVAPNRTSK